MQHACRATSDGERRAFLGDLCPRHRVCFSTRTARYLSFCSNFTLAEMHHACEEQTSGGVGALEEAAVVGGISALGTALFSIGIPKNSVEQYETEVKNIKSIAGMECATRPRKSS